MWAHGLKDLQVSCWFCCPSLIKCKHQNYANEYGFHMKYQSYTYTHGIKQNPMSFKPSLGAWAFGDLVRSSNSRRQGTIHQGLRSINPWVNVFQDLRAKRWTKECPEFSDGCCGTFTTAVQPCWTRKASLRRPKPQHPASSSKISKISVMEWL